MEASSFPFVRSISPRYSAVMMAPNTLGRKDGSILALRRMEDSSMAVSMYSDTSGSVTSVVPLFVRRAPSISETPGKLVSSKPREERGSYVFPSQYTVLNMYPWSSSPATPMASFKAWEMFFLSFFASTTRRGMFLWHTKKSGLGKYELRQQFAGGKLKILGKFADNHCYYEDNFSDV